MQIHETGIWDRIDSARTDLSGTIFYDHEAGIEHNIPAKDKKLYAAAYDYYYANFDNLIRIGNLLEEINYINKYVKETPISSAENENFKTDFLLEFSYKNWVIRINLLAELLVQFTNHAYKLRLPLNEKLMNDIFNNEKVMADKKLYLVLLNVVDFLEKNLLPNTNSKSLKRNRNKIVHNAIFKHKIINDLSTKLISYELELNDYTDPTDKLIDENVASIQIGREIGDITNKFFFHMNELFSLIEIQFKNTISDLMENPS